MDLNFIFFPVPQQKYSQEQHQGELIWIPKLPFIESKGETVSVGQEISYLDSYYLDENCKKETQSQGYPFSKKQQPKITQEPRKIPYFGNVLKTRAQFFFEDQQKKDELLGLSTRRMESNLSSGKSRGDVVSIFKGDNLDISQQLQSKGNKEAIIQAIISQKTQQTATDVNPTDGSFVSCSLFLESIDEHQKTNIQTQNMHSLPLPPAQIQKYATKQFNHNNFSLKNLKFGEKQLSQKNSIYLGSTTIPKAGQNTMLPDDSRVHPSSCYVSSLRVDQSNKKNQILTQNKNILLNQNSNSQYQSPATASSSPLNKNSDQSPNKVRVINAFNNEGRQQGQYQFYESPSKDITSKTLNSCSSQPHLNQNNNNFSSPYKSKQPFVQADKKQSSHQELRHPSFYTSRPAEMNRSNFKNLLESSISQNKIYQAIPCLFLKSAQPSNYVLIYFHGNGEDISLSYELTNHIRKTLMVNVLSVEYRGYGLYEGKIDDECILSDSQYIYNFLTRYLMFPARNILVLGRSIGTGPATWLAAHHQVRCLILMSPFSSLRAVVKHIAGSIAQHFVKERFINLDNIKNVQNPTFIVHGQEDPLIPYSQSQLLHDSCGGPCQLLLPKRMTHITLDFNNDFTTPLKQFLLKNGINIAQENNYLSINSHICLPLFLFEKPSMTSSSSSFLNTNNNQRQ